MEDLEKKYQETLDWIYSWIDFSMKRHVDDTHRFFKLDRMNKLMSLLEHPEQRFKSIHITGTKGKGSTASFCANALQTSGYKVGLYTSPHLEEFRERIQINGQMIERQTLVDLADKLRPLTEIVPDITTFELTTALAFLYFAQEKVDFTVLEVGLGGRLDATNVVLPLVSIITTISYDHVAVLGDTLTEIAYEKGGIIKANCPVVIGPQFEEAEKELIRIAKEKNAPYVLVERDYQYIELAHTLKSQQIKIQKSASQENQSHLSISSARSPLKLEIPLLGHHQMENAATSLAALDVLRQSGVHMTRKTIKKGFSQVNWPARFEIFRKNPPIILDSAHNGDSMEKLRQTIDEYFPKMEFILIFGVSADKELDAMLKSILPRMQHVIATQSIHPRAKNADELKTLIEKYTISVTVASPAENAFAEALEMAGESKGILVTGSIFIAAAGRSILPQFNIGERK